MPTDFYMNGYGDRFIDATYYTTKILQFFKEERELLDRFSSSIDVLIEVGCMHGRYLNWTIENNKHYIGIDRVDDYINQGQQLLLNQGLSFKKYQFIKGDARELSTLIHPLKSTGVRAMILFPFNCFGNIIDFQRVITNLEECSFSFIISSYQTSQDATLCRYEYYHACGYSQLQISHDEDGVCITSAEGLHSMAYQPEFLQRAFHKHGLHIQTIPFSLLGIAYVKMKNSDLLYKNSSSLAGIS